LIFTAGLTARDKSGQIVAPGDIKGQTRQVFHLLKSLLAEEGAELRDVVRLGFFLRDITEMQEVYGIRRELWPVDPPASTTVEVSRLVTDDVRIEIEAVAAVPHRRAS
jgi:enamine deaminase RidA (YjgF/YER057c/UK114 family)